TPFWAKIALKCTKNHLKSEKKRGFRTCGKMRVKVDEKPVQGNLESQKGLIDLELTLFFRLIAREGGVSMSGYGSGRRRRYLGINDCIAIDLTTLKKRKLLTGKKATVG